MSKTDKVNDARKDRQHSLTDKWTLEHTQGRKPT